MKRKCLLVMLGLLALALAAAPALAGTVSFDATHNFTVQFVTSDSNSVTDLNAFANGDGSWQHQPIIATIMSPVEPRRYRQPSPGLI